MGLNKLNLHSNKICQKTDFIGSAILRECKSSKKKGKEGFTMSVRREEDVNGMEISKMILKFNLKK